MPIKIFLCYRKSDARRGAALLDEGLMPHFDAECVFRASRSIPLGARWEETMIEAVRGSRVLLAIIGPHWLDAVDDEGRRRLDNPDDFVRREIRTALDAGVRVVPVLLDETADLRQADLPADIADLAAMQSARVHSRSSHHDIERLADRLRAAVPELAVPPREPAPAAAGSAPVTFGAFHGSILGNVLQSNNMTVNGDFNAWKGTL